MTSASFKALFPEFSEASTTLVEAALARAERRAGAGNEDMLAYLAAHYLALSPGGRKLRQTPQGVTKEGDETTPYLKEYLDLSRIEGAGVWVA
jgi:hypothetical protein